MIRIREPRDILNIGWRRGRYLVGALLIGLTVSLAVSLFWPPTYRSIATILIEQSDVPDGLVGSPKDIYADNRVQIVTQRVMTTMNLVSIIERLDLYSNKRDVKPVSLIAEDMRKDITLDLVNAPTSRRTEVAIAFNLAFDHGNAKVARDTLAELVALYVDENARSQREKANETANFLKQEAEKHRAAVNRLEEELAAFKEQNAGRLPDQISAKFSERQGIQRELVDIQKRLESLDERRIYLTAQLAQVVPIVPPAGDRTQWSVAERLRALQAEYVTLSSRYGPNHPDVLRVTRELEALEADVQVGADRGTLEAKRDALQARLSALMGTYSSAHPEVQKIKREIAAVDKILARAPLDSTSTNPIAIQLQAQLSAVQAEYSALLKQQSSRRELLATYDKDIREGPSVEREYRALTRDYESAVSNYADVQEKERRAELGAALEEQNRTERFTLLEGPTLPLRPHAPDMKVVLAVVMLLSVLIGFGTAVLLEVLDDSIHSARQLAEMTGIPPLAVIPRIKTKADILRARLYRIAGVAIGVAAVLAIVLLNPQLRGAVNNLLGTGTEGAIELSSNLEVGN